MTVFLPFPNQTAAAMQRRVLAAVMDLQPPPKRCRVATFFIQNPDEPPAYTVTLRETWRGDRLTMIEVTSAGVPGMRSQTATADQKKQGVPGMAAKPPTAEQEGEVAQ